MVSGRACMCLSTQVYCIAVAAFHAQNLVVNLVQESIECFKGGQQQAATQDIGQLAAEVQNLRLVKSRVDSEQETALEKVWQLEEEKSSLTEETAQLQRSLHATSQDRQEVQ